MQGVLGKMQVVHAPGMPVQYSLKLSADEAGIALNELIGKQLRLTWLRKITCIHCGRITKKSFNQGYCFPCSQRLAQCDLCIVSPSRCSYDKGGCREPEWGLANCMIPHAIYLANSSGLKVGITRAHQRFTRWMDQGASAAIVVGLVATRKQAGDIEHLLTKTYKDKTDWRRLLRGEPEPVDLVAAKSQIIQELNPQQLQAATDEVSEFKYPVARYPEKIVSLNLEKSELLTGTLQGVKGQYLIFDIGVINIRKYTGYHVIFEAIT